MMQLIRLILSFFLISFAPAWAKEYRATLISVVDADTQKYQVDIWPDQSLEINIRLTGVDTAETRRPSKLCPFLEKQHGQNANAFVESLLSPGDEVTITNVKLGKFARRAIANVWLSNGNSLSSLLLSRNFAVPYDGGKKPDWCAILSSL